MSSEPKILYGQLLKVSGISTHSNRKCGRKFVFRFNCQLQTLTKIHLFWATGQRHGNS